MGASPFAYITTPPVLALIDGCCIRQDGSNDWAWANGQDGSTPGNRPWGDLWEGSTGAPLVPWRQEQPVGFVVVEIVGGGCLEHWSARAARTVGHSCQSLLAYMRSDQRLMVAVTFTVTDLAASVSAYQRRGGHEACSDGTNTWRSPMHAAQW